jgi:hypothetical protein
MEYCKDVAYIYDKKWYAGVLCCKNETHHDWGLHQVMLCTKEANKMKRMPSAIPQNMSHTNEPVKYCM